MTLQQGGAAKVNVVKTKLLKPEGKQLLLAKLKSSGLGFVVLQQLQLIRCYFKWCRQPITAMLVLLDSGNTKHIHTAVIWIPVNRLGLKLQQTS